MSIKSQNEKTSNHDMDVAAEPANFRIHDRDDKARINKLPSIKKPKLVFKTGNKYDRDGSEKWKAERLNRVWTETKVYVLPAMPTDQDEKNVYIEKEFRCFYCDELCDAEYLECKVCPKVFHTICLYRRGHLNNLKVPLKLEWACFDCSDLSKILTDEEIRKIINIYDELDFRRNCYVNFDDYMNIKRKMYEEDGEVLTKDRELFEKARFRLIDKDKSGTITWSEFVEFEAADLLSKKNKIELSNYLSIKELVFAKKRFLSFVKDDTKMITRENAKICYMELIDKLRRKLGPAFGAHLSNCADLFGLNPQTDIIVNTAKTIWPEFIRKLTILLLYDRKNFSVFQPRHWKPGIWNSIVSRPKNSYLLERENSNILSKLPFLNPPIQSARVKSKKTKSKFGIEQIMSPKMDMSKFKPHRLSEFGSIELVIRSKSRQNQPEFASSSEIDWSHLESSRKLKRSLNMTKSKNFSESYPNLVRNENTRDLNGPVSFDEFKYDVVTKSIYEKLGREKQFCDYPQKIPLPTSRKSKLPDSKRLKAVALRNIWERENARRRRSVDNGADVKFLDKILSSKDFQTDI